MWVENSVSSVRNNHFANSARDKRGKRGMRSCFFVRGIFRHDKGIESIRRSDTKKYRGWMTCSLRSGFKDDKPRSISIGGRGRCGQGAMKGPEYTSNSLAAVKKKKKHGHLFFRLCIYRRVPPQEKRETSHIVVLYERLIDPLVVGSHRPIR